MGNEEMKPYRFWEKPARCPHCGYTPDAIPPGSDAYAQANCEHREGHAKTEPEPLRECCDPKAAVVPCCICGKPVHTCEADNASGANNHVCPAHPEGCELESGEWACSEQCYEVACALYLMRQEGFTDDADSVAKYISDLTRRLAEAKRRGDTWKVQANKNCQDMGLISKRLEAAEARVLELEAANLEKDVQRCEANMHAEAAEARVPESDDVAEALAEISAAGLKGVAVGLRLHIKGLTRRLAEAEEENGRFAGRLESSVSDWRKLYTEERAERVRIEGILLNDVQDERQESDEHIKGLVTVIKTQDKNIGDLKAHIQRIEVDHDDVEARAESAEARVREMEEKAKGLESALAGEKAAREHDRSVRWALPEEMVVGCPDDIRALGWAVAVHNDYKMNGVKHTFWLFTKGDSCMKGEGLTDAEALNEVRAALAATEVKNG